MLEHIELPPQYKIGNEKIDDQHSQLLFALMQVVKLIKNEDHKNDKQLETEITELLKSLRTYTSTHFQYEERLMEKIKFPDFESHKLMHKYFTDKLIEIQKNALKLKKEKNQVLLKDTAILLKDWLMKHIVEEDKKIITYQVELESKANVEVKMKAQSPT